MCGRHRRLSAGGQRAITCGDVSRSSTPPTLKDGQDRGRRASTSERAFMNHSAEIIFVCVESKLVLLVLALMVSSKLGF
nr:hypothetical protein [Tanacetum cinerariifolium]